MKKKLYSVVILLLLAAPASIAVADDGDADTPLHGTIELGVRGVHVRGDSARMQEFVELNDSALAGVQLEYLKKAYNFQFEADQIGSDDQSFVARGGRYLDFKYTFNYTEMTHNYGFDAIAPYEGIGSQQITRIADPSVDLATWTNLSNWTRFDYKVEHKKYGGEMEISMNSPYFINIGVERREQEGLRPYSTDRPESAEVPEPVLNTTDNIHLRAGYRGETLISSITGFMSSFDNDHNYMNTDDTPDYSNFAALAPDNDFYKLAADLTLRDLPLSSVLSAAASYSKLETSYTASDLNLPATFAGGVWNIGGLANVNTDRFDGEVDHTSFSVAVSSKPLDKLGTKVYYRYLERDNKSSRVTTEAVRDTDTEHLSYDRDIAGIDIGYRLPQKTKLSAGYEYQKSDRSTPDGTNLYPTDTTKDQTGYLRLKNSALDWLKAKVSYTHTKRDSGDIEAGNPTFFAYQDQSSDAWELDFDIYPLDNRLDLGLIYTYKKIDYDDVIQSRTGDTRQSTYLDASYYMFGRATFSGSAGYETVKTDTNGINDPSDYTQTTDDTFWFVGLAANIKGLLNYHLTLDLSCRYQESDGEIYFSNDMTGDNLQNITESDDYIKKTMEAKGTYAIDNKLSVTAGYIYEKLEYTDFGYNAFQNILVSDLDPASVEFSYSGLYADQNYEANIGYLMVKYGF